MNIQKQPTSFARCLPRCTLPTAASILLLFLLLGSSLQAQTTNGVISGTVTDTAGGILQGARIELLPNGPRAVSDAQGAFTLRDVPPGQYSVHVTYLGFAPYQTTANLASGATVQVKAVLDVASQQETVNVTAERAHGEAEAINREWTAPNVVQILPAEVIKSLPNANVADAIGRLPSVTLERDEGEGKYVQIRGTEPRFTNTTIDGVNVPSPESGVRQVKLDVVPSDLVESVELSKTLTANMDGDAIGGSVNLVTKTAGEQPTITLEGLGGYTPILTGRGQDEFDATVGYRFGRQKKLGILIGGTYDWNGRGINDVEPAPCAAASCGANGLSVNSYGTEDIREYRYYRGRWGLEGGADYKINDNASLFLNGLYSHFNNFGDRWVFTPSINNFLTPTLGDSTGNETMNASIRRPVQTIGMLQGGGRQSFSNSSVLLWDFSVSRASTTDKGYSQANFGGIDGNSPLNNVQYGLNLSNPYRPRFNVLNGVNIYDPSLYYLQGLDVSRTYSPQLNLQIGASYSKGYSWDGHFGTFEVGGKFRNEHKFQDSNDVYYLPTDPAALNASSVLSHFTDPNYYDGSYKLGPIVNYTKLRSFFNANLGTLFTEDFPTTLAKNQPNNWDEIERVSAGYLMNTIELGRFRLYAGLRLEATDESVAGYSVAGNVISTIGRTSSYIDPLPSVELRYRLDNDSRIRLAYGRGLSRPNFGDIAPDLVLADSPPRTIDVGNPALNPTHANNYDILYERQLNPLGLVQAGFFYKSITDPIYYLTTPVTSGPYAGYSQFGPANGSSAYLYGFEVSFQQHLSYLPGLLSGAGISANYSWTTSQANGVSDGRTDHPTLLRQAPNTWNVSPTYDKGRVSVRVGISYNGANLFSYNGPGKGPDGDTFLYAHLQLDAQGSYRVGHGVSAIVYGLNLNNEVFGFYNGSPIYPIQREYYKPTVGAGVRYEFPAER